MPIPALRAAGKETENEQERKEKHDANFGKLTIKEKDPVVTERTERIKELIAVVEDDSLVKKNRLKIHKAMVRLGRMKAVEAVPAIVERLDLHIAESGRLVIMSEPRPYEDAYPAMQALMAIGEPALPFIADALGAKPRSEKYKRLVRTTVVLIAGNKGKARQYLRERIRLYEKGKKELYPLTLSVEELYPAPKPGRKDKPKP
jgi:hypothetical protein